MRLPTWRLSASSSTKARSAPPTRGSMSNARFKDTEFVEKLVVARAQGMQPGDPLDPASKMGAIVDRKQADGVMEVRRGRQADG